MVLSVKLEPYAVAVRVVVVRKCVDSLVESLRRLQGKLVARSPHRRRHRSRDSDPDMVGLVASADRYKDAVVVAYKGRRRPLVVVHIDDAKLEVPVAMEASAAGRLKERKGGVGNLEVLVGYVTGRHFRILERHKLNAKAVWRRRVDVDIDTLVEVGDT